MHYQWQTKRAEKRGNGRKERNRGADELRQEKRDLLDELRLIEARQRVANEARKRRQNIYPKIIPFEE